MAALGHSGLPQWKEGLCTLCKKRGGGFTNEYRMYNRERARPLFVWNVDHGSQGALWAFILPTAREYRNFRSGQQDGNQRGTVICLCLAWKSGPLVYSLCGVFLEDGLFWTARELCALFSVIFVCVCVKIVKADRSVLQSRVWKNKLFLPWAQFLRNPFHPLTRNWDIVSGRKLLCLFFYYSSRWSCFYAICSVWKVQLGWVSVGSVCLPVQLLPFLRTPLCIVSSLPIHRGLLLPCGSWGCRREPNL